MVTGQHEAMEGESVRTYRKTAHYERDKYHLATRTACLSRRRTDYNTVQPLEMDARRSTHKIGTRYKHAEDEYDSNRKIDSPIESPDTKH